MPSPLHVVLLFHPRSEKAVTLAETLLKGVGGLPRASAAVGE